MARVPFVPLISFEKCMKDFIPWALPLVSIGAVIKGLQ
jgi:hypothetical protein